MSAAVQLRDVTVTYGDLTVLESVDLEVETGSSLAVLGPSGSGKSTLLGAIAGLVAVDRGTISVGGVVVVDPETFVPPERRNVAMVFQDFALWPHLSVRETVGYPLRVTGEPMESRRRRTAQLLDRFGIAELANRFPDELSGGQQQRVGLARAMARNATVMLLDEPTAHLDAPLRSTLQSEITETRRTRTASSIVATHDAAEALAVSDRVALLREGRVVQVGSPVEVYERPVDLWAATLTGPASILRGEFMREGEGVAMRLGSVSMTVKGDGLGGGAEALVRPDWVRFGGPLQGRVHAVHFRGTHTDHVIESDVGRIELRTLGGPRARTGETVSWSVERLWVLA